ncbi:MAG: hypothetical protein H8E21_04845 [Gammaproteobacteria bacterium]|nr:hypothetical protein [Gammaproteobacteria bacterium]MBL7001038.1 hypothetical protein [Gammaproteobacteria bacterium]
MAKNLLSLLLLGLLVNPVFAATERIVYHVHHTDDGSFRRVISNLENLQQGMSDQQLEIKLLLQGNSIQLLDPKRHASALQQRFNTLLASGIGVEVEREYLNKNPQLKNAGVQLQVLDSLFGRIIELQNQGYLYITP